MSNLVCFDTETTGLVNYFESIIEISAVRFDINNEVVIDKFTSLLDPMKEVPPIITKITGLTGEDLKDAPPFWETLENFCSFIREDDILFAHNAPFDVGFVGLWMSKIFERLPSNRIYDTIAIAKKIFPNLRSYKLEALISKLGLEGSNEHRAEADVLATISLIKKCFEKMSCKPYNKDKIKSLLASNHKHLNFNQFAIKPVNLKDDTIKVIYSAIRGKNNLRITYDYNTNNPNTSGIFEDIKLQPLTIFAYKNEVYIEGFEVDGYDTAENIHYFRRIDIKKIKEIELIKRDKNFIKPISIDKKKL